MTSLRRQLARELVPGAAVGPAVFNHVQVSPRCGHGEDFLVPGTAVGAGPLEDLWCAEALGKKQLSIESPGREAGGRGGWGEFHMSLLFSFGGGGEGGCVL